LGKSSAMDAISPGRKTFLNGMEEKITNIEEGKKFSGEREWPKLGKKKINTAQGTGVSHSIIRKEKGKPDSVQICRKGTPPNVKVRGIERREELTGKDYSSRRWDARQHE